MISIRNVSFKYAGGKSNALSGINIDIQDGEFLGIIGSSGAGKSTLTYAINGIVPRHYRGAFYGELAVNGLDTIEAGTEKLSLEVGSVFQDIDAQMTSSVVEDEILFALENFGIDRDEIEVRIDEALCAAQIPDLRYRSISSLSGGQRQRTTLARALIRNPQLLLLDDTLSAVDNHTQRIMLESLAKVCKDRSTIIISHKLSAVAHATEILYLERGQVRERGTHAQLIEQGGAYASLWMQQQEEEVKAL